LVQDRAADHGQRESMESPLPKICMLPGNAAHVFEYTLVVQ
jgi:hypothetical protein